MRAAANLPSSQALPLPALLFAGASILYGNFTPAEHANFLAAKVIAYATAYLDGRNDAAALGISARSAMLELVVATDDPTAKAILDPARLLAVAMLNTSAAEGEARQDRWMQVMGALVEMVRHESRELKKSGAQRS